MVESCRWESFKVEFVCRVCGFPYEPEDERYRSREERRVCPECLAARNYAGFRAGWSDQPSDGAGWLRLWRVRRWVSWLRMTGCPGKKWTITDGRGRYAMRRGRLAWTSRWDEAASWTSVGNGWRVVDAEEVARMLRGTVG